MDKRIACLRAGVASIVFAGVALGGSVQAKDDCRYGTTDPKVRAWIEGLTDIHNVPCCATADGTVPDTSSVLVEASVSAASA